MVYTFGPPTLLHLVVSALVLSDSQRAEECSNEAVKALLNAESPNHVVRVTLVCGVRGDWRRLVLLVTIFRSTEGFLIRDDSI